MSRAEAAAGPDRLPWLPDEPKVQATKPRPRGMIASLLITAPIVAGLAFWFGARDAQENALPAPAAQKVATVRLPAARPAEPVQPQVELAAPPEVEPIVAPPTPVVEQPPVIRRSPGHRTVVSPKAEPAPKAEPPALEPWPVRIVDGAAGRLVRVGAFSSVHQAKRGWWAITKVNPALKHLPALVVPVQSLRNGQVYYRLQMGTTSQAHSAVLCQRMRMIAEPCVVIGVSPQA